MASKVNKALEHVLRAVLEKTAEFHRERDEYDFAEFGDTTCLPEDPCYFCRIQTATLAAVADVWENLPEFDPHDETPHHNS